MTTARLVWISCLIMAGLAPFWVLMRRRIFDQGDRKAALGFLLAGFVGIFVAGWFLLPAPEEGSEAPAQAAPPPLPLPPA